MKHRYLNKITGVVVETKCTCAGDNWQDITPEHLATSQEQETESVQECRESDAEKDDAASSPRSKKGKKKA